jgi:membrane protease YdiL (CAAX protease family)
MNDFKIIQQFSFSTIATYAICLFGLILFTNWLINTSFLGRKALVDSLSRRNNMPPYLPFVPFFIWFAGVWLIMFIVRKLPDNALPAFLQKQEGGVDNFVLCLGAIASIVLIIFLARKYFARRLKGFGLNIKTIPKDFMAAVINLLSIWPILVFVVTLTTLLGKFIFNSDFELQPHEELKLLAENSQLTVRILIVVTAVIIVPAFEEMLFRGLFQTMIRSYLVKPWPSIAICSFVFATIHSNTGHWPALFVLSMCLGYSYEKSNSLFRPIFIHCLFNATSVAVVLIQPAIFP